MSRILCFDYGTKRIGIAVTDELKIIASPLVTCDTSKIFNFVDQYITKHNIDLFLVGMPLDLMGKPTNATSLTKSFISINCSFLVPLPQMFITEFFSAIK